jgi:hypothetical protein
LTEFILNIANRQICNLTNAKEVFNSLKDGKYLVQIKSIKKRSLPQNAYYWGVVVPMVKDGLQQVGYNDVKENEDAHEIMKYLFLKKKMKSELNDDEIIIAGSTADLKTKQFNIYLEEIWQWAAEYLNIQIPHPNEQTVLFNERSKVASS